MLKELKELWGFRELLYVMVQRELRIRYKNSILGIFWSFLNPVVQVGVMTLVFGRILNIGVPSYSAYILASYLPFMFIQFCVLDSAQSVLASLPLIKKIYFPREILPLATVISNFIHLLIGFGVFFMFLLITFVRHPQVNPFQAGTLMLPALLAVSLMMAIGLGFIISALNTFYEDVKYVAGIAMYLLFFLSPVMYFTEQVAATGANIESGNWLFRIYHLNPLAVLCTAYRKALLAPVDVPIRGAEVSPPVDLNPLYYVWLVVFSFSIMVFGYWFFNRVKWKFVERP